MRIGGQFKQWNGANEARLVLAYTGVTRFSETGWAHIRARHWVIDYIHHGQQPQRIGRDAHFTRLSNVAALYEPGLWYHEHKQRGERITESYILFEATGSTARALRTLTRPGKHCHIHDSEHQIGDRLRQLGQVFFHRKPRSEWLAQGLLLELIGLALQSVPVGGRARALPGQRGEAPRSLIESVERYVRAHLSEPIRIGQLAAHARRSESAFAHAYSRLAGESPHRTVLRLKIEAGKRLLLRDQRSVKETAASVGFASEFHFSRVFKRIEGISPSEYQRALLKRR